MVRGRLTWYWCTRLDGVPIVTVNQSSRCSVMNGWRVVSRRRRWILMLVSLDNASSGSRDVDWRRRHDNRSVVRLAAVNGCCCCHCDVITADCRTWFLHVYPANWRHIPSLFDRHSVQDLRWPHWPVHSSSRNCPAARINSLHNFVFYKSEPFN